MSEPDKISRILTHKRPVLYGHWSRFNHQPMVSGKVLRFWLALILLAALGFFVSGCVNQGQGWGVYPDSPFYELRQFGDRIDQTDWFVLPGTRAMERKLDNLLNSRDTGYRPQSIASHYRHGKQRCKILNEKGTPEHQACVDLHIELDWDRGLIE